ncbi:hypothetical protein [Capnocytophaga sputigena]|uniref:hypothetical protein n=1 Tax=Capnocytophaga sputigena TaxID=1019 RepID=UPI000BB57A35|nr:hypothetical protein [Capnocytophaga sputigena]PBN47981.1 hypothetical protein CDC50_05350 [Capnocytophaga sputigena]
MSVTVTIEQTSPQANAIIEMLRAFDFVTFKEPKKAKTLAAPQYVASDEILEEDENGIPLEHKDFILDLSRKINKKIAKRWDEHFNF